jgi:hypothetical protein
MTKADRANVNVTLGLLGSGDGSLLSRQFPCPVCGAAMLIRPYSSNFDGTLRTGPSRVPWA